VGYDELFYAVLGAIIGAAALYVALRKQLRDEIEEKVSQKLELAERELQMEKSFSRHMLTEHDLHLVNRPIDLISDSRAYQVSANPAGRDEREDRVAEADDARDRATKEVRQAIEWLGADSAAVIKRALKVLYAVAGVLPAASAVHFAIGVAHQRLAESDEQENLDEKVVHLSMARDSYGEAIRLDPSDYRAINNRGLTIKDLATLRQHEDPQSAADQLREALDAFDIALQIKPDDAYPAYNKGAACMALSRILVSEPERIQLLRNATQAFSRARSADPSDGDTPIAWASSLVALAREQEERHPDFAKECLWDAVALARAESVFTSGGSEAAATATGAALLELSSHLESEDLTLARHFATLALTQFIEAVRIAPNSPTAIEQLLGAATAVLYNMSGSDYAIKTATECSLVLSKAIPEHSPPLQLSFQAALATLRGLAIGDFDRSESAKSFRTAVAHYATLLQRDPGDGHIGARCLFSYYQLLQVVPEEERLSVADAAVEFAQASEADGGIVGRALTATQALLRGDRDNAEGLVRQVCSESTLGVALILNNPIWDGHIEVQHGNKQPTSSSRRGSNPDAEDRAEAATANRLRSCSGDAESDVLDDDPLQRL